MNYELSIILDKYYTKLIFVNQVNSAFFFRRDAQDLHRPSNPQITEDMEIDRFIRLLCPTVFSVDVFGIIAYNQDSQV